MARIGTSWLNPRQLLTNSGVGADTLRVGERRFDLLDRQPSVYQVLHFNVLVKIRPMQHLAIRLDFEVLPLGGRRIGQTRKTGKGHRDPPPVAQEHSKFMAPDG